MKFSFFVFFPETEEQVLKLCDSECLDRVLSDAIELIGLAKKKGTIFFDSQNITTFIDDIAGLLEDTRYTGYLQNFRTKLKTTMGMRTARAICGKPYRAHNCQYFLWNLENCSVEPVSNLLSDASECTLQENEKVVLLNLAGAINSKRAFLPIIKDSAHIQGLPVFTCIQFVSNVDELDLWLSGYPGKFSLLNCCFFEKTTFIQQGKAVYKEIETGYFWYLDNFHKTHYEVFDSKGQHLGEASLEGKLDKTKKDNGRTIKVN